MIRPLGVAYRGGARNQNAMGLNSGRELWAGNTVKVDALDRTHCHARSRAGNLRLLAVVSTLLNQHLRLWR